MYRLFIPDIGWFSVVADVHAVDGTPAEEGFLRILEEISVSMDNVVFLGDIMDLWIGLPRYETPLQRRFLEWCRAEKERRRVYFIEGNHEYYVARCHKDVFFEASDKYIAINGVYFTHGHTIQGSLFSFNRIFGCLAKSAIACFVMEIMPFGKSFAHFLKRLLGGRHDCTFVPRECIARWLARQDASCCIIGHFHEEAEIVSEGKKAIVLPRALQ